MSIRVKICGVCSSGDAELALSAGADHVGVIVSAPGPRAQGVAGAARVFASVPPAARVGVFANAGVSATIEAARSLSLGVVQLHGGESAADAAAIGAGLTGAGTRVWKVVHARGAADVAAAVDAFAGAVDGLLLDSAAGGQAGGTGRRFDWAAVAPGRDAAAELTLIVAGGLTPDNVAEAVTRFRPDVVDVSSGVESAVGRKSEVAVRAFVARARAAAG